VDYVKLKDLIVPEFQQALQALMNADNSIKASYAIIKTFRIINDLQSDYETLRTGLIQKYGKRGEDGKALMNEGRTQYLIENKKEFDSEFKSLLELEVEILKIPLSAVENTRLTPAMLMILQPIINNEK
jgi:hypothetical protein